MNRALVHALWGFAFGTVGLYLLAFLALMAAPIETITSPLMWPGRTVAEALMGAEGSSLEVALLTFLNGIFYAALFVLIGRAYPARTSRA
jgi:hypothetical protein